MQPDVSKSDALVSDVDIDICLEILKIVADRVKNSESKLVL